MEPAIGLAVGRGTGPELAAVFERVLAGISGAYGTTVDLIRSDRTYHSYVSLKTDAEAESVREITQDDADHYTRFCRTLAVAGVPAVFRTAINAQSLYLVRRRLQAAKVDAIPTPEGSLLLVRDQAQGFYTGENTHVPGALVRTMAFSREITEKVITLALRRARQEWPDGRIDEIVMAYKFHLLDGALEEWVSESAARHGVHIGLYQPDTVNRNLIERGPRPRTVIIAGNEWADIMHVVLLDRFGSERQENRCTENVYLHPDANGLIEYQTVHGSADDLAGADKVNPVATIRAAAVIAERHAGCAGAALMVERGLRALGRHGVATPDAGGAHSTTAVVDALLDVLEPESRPVLMADS
ncbi:isocitrate/isopropylmalate family dehydrogenase [Nonomuraea spiralis]|uniref:Isocitrate/isopropylmalate family dehydrogenase n=1 Tax=Nonomuraea spiralis TaxID=46182 RepID=A0ABV5IMJ8_9ACTN|nr:isocitrate/isopropylmalate family dehydrogenase [Nonomuraea spiralis]GGT00327.1 isocitrate dehydrogenase [Nonomuraea spiralis]